MNDERKTKKELAAELNACRDELRRITQLKDSDATFVRPGQKQEALRENQRYLETIIESSPT